MTCKKCDEPMDHVDTLHSSMDFEDAVLEYRCSRCGAVDWVRGGNKETVDVKSNHQA